jgi:excisionase family DNA binding protein
MNTHGTTQQATTPTAQPEYISIPEAAELVRVSPWTMRQWLTQGKVRRYKCIGRTLVSKGEVLALVKPEEQQ